jgi:nicotinamidase-related amidase
MTNPESLSPASRPVVHPDGSPVDGSEPNPGSVSMDPARTAVIVVDVQRLFTDMAGAPIDPPLDEVLPRIRRFVEESRSAEAMIVLVRTIIAPDAHSLATLQWPEFMRLGMAPESIGTEFDPCLDRQPGDVEIVKQRYSAFFGTPLDELLRARDIDTVAILGLTTNVCVQSTARDAWQRDYRTITVGDCCAEIGEGSHAASLAWTSRNFGAVAESTELSKAWRTHASARH